MKSKIIELLNKLNDSQLETLYKDILQKTCEHNSIIKGTYGSAICKDCNQYQQSHYCEKSPDNLCHYYSKKDNQGYYLIIKNQRHNLPANHNNKWETEDSCIFCKEPDERK